MATSGFKGAFFPSAPPEQEVKITNITIIDRLCGLLNKRIEQNKGRILPDTFTLFLEIDTALSVEDNLKIMCKSFPPENSSYRNAWIYAFMLIDACNDKNLILKQHTLRRLLTTALLAAMKVVKLPHFDQQKLLLAKEMNIPNEELTQQLRLFSTIILTHSALQSSNKLYDKYAHEVGETFNFSPDTAHSASAKRKRSK